MDNRIGFDSDRYLREQTEAIAQRVALCDNKLYLEFGGKLIGDYHAARVLPGYDPNAKMSLLERFRDQVEVILCLYAGDIVRRKIRADLGITYDADALRLLDAFAGRQIKVCGVVITRYEGQSAAEHFKRRLENRGVPVFVHGPTKGYPNDVDTIVSEAGYGANDYIPTERPIVIVTAPGPGSGKLATCLSQLYHEHRRGIRSGYAKYEGFPVWNIPLKHPLNLAYEAATADLGDVNLIDHFHLEAYEQKTVNYNRDLEAFPILQRILQRITGRPQFYRSPTDMGVNRIAWGIVDDAVVQEASKQEILRRYFRYSCEAALGQISQDAVRKLELIMKELDLVPEDRKVVAPAREAAQVAKLREKDGEGTSGCAIELPDGTIVTGKSNALLHASASAMLNAAKTMAEIPDGIDLLPPHLLQSLYYFKKDLLNQSRLSLDLEETLIALSLSATSNPAAAAAVEKLLHLRGREAHTAHMLSPGDESAFRKLGIHLTCDPYFSSKSLFES